MVVIYEPHSSLLILLYDDPVLVAPPPPRGEQLGTRRRIHSASPLFLKQRKKPGA